MIEDFLGELQALAGGLAAGDDAVVGQRVVSGASWWSEGFVEGVREGQRVAGERLRDILECYGDLHC